MSEENFIKKLEALKDLAFKESTPNISVLKLIKRELFSVKKSDRDFLKAFVGELNEKLFTSSISIQGLDLETYFKNGQKDLEISKEKIVEDVRKQTKKQLFFYGDEVVKKTQPVPEPVPKPVPKQGPPQLGDDGFTQSEKSYEDYRENVQSRH